MPPKLSPRADGRTSVSPLSGSDGPISSPGDSSPDDNLILEPGPDLLPPRALLFMAESNLGQITAALAQLLQRLTVGTAPAQAALPPDAVVVGVLRLLQDNAVANLAAWQ